MNRLKIKPRKVMSTMYRFKIRGIYSTALAQLLLKENYKPTQLSDILRARFKLKGNNEPYDVIIIDKRDLQGVRVQGIKEAVEKVVNIIRKYFKSAIVWYYRPQLYSIYVGEVLKEVEQGEYLVNLGDYKGILATSRTLNEGEKVLVSVKSVTLDDICKLTENITIVGRYARLIKNGKISISNHIKNYEKRFELLSLAYTLCPKGWGLRWRSSAEYASLNDLIEEVEKLKKEIEEIENIKLKEIKLVREGEQLVEIEFPSPCKKIADELRNEVISTIKGHHYIRAWGKDVALLVDYAELLIDNGLDRDKISYLTRQFLSKLKPKEGEVLRIEHVKLDGRVAYLTPGKVMKRENELFIIKRIFKSSGIYDGLDVERMPNDYSETIIAEESPVIVHRYHRDDGTLIGEYYNLNTPVEIYGNTARYVDLAVDIVMKEDEILLRDEKELNKALEKGIISREMYEETLILVKRVKELLESGYNGHYLIKELLSRSDYNWST